MSNFNWQPGQVVVVEGERRSLLHRLIAWSQGWWWTHCFMVVAPDRAVEATFPRVREFGLSERLAAYAKAGRAVRVLEYYEATPVQQLAVAAKARSYVGRWYNVLAVVWFFFFKTFNRTGGGSHWFCSRLITASYREGARIDLTKSVDIMPGSMYARTPAMRDGYVTPAEVLCDLHLVTAGVSGPDGTIEEMLG